MGGHLPGNRGWIAAGKQLSLKCVGQWGQQCLLGIPFAKKGHKQNLETLMTTTRSLVHVAMAALLSAGMAAHAQPATDSATGTAASSAPKASEAASGKKATHKSKKAKKPAAQASNPGTSGGAGNRSGGERKDGASFSAPRPGGAASKPTGTGWD